MKRSGFRKLTYAEVIEKQEQARAKKSAQPKSVRKVKYPTILGIKGSRYTGIKGVLWTIFSRYIRKRDFILYNGRCVSCSTTVSDWKLADPGHYVSVSRGNFRNIFSEKGVNLQCKKCNNPKWTPDASIPYALELDRRYGPGTAEQIRIESEGYAGSYSELEYMREIERFKNLFAKL